MLAPVLFAIGAATATPPPPIVDDRAAKIDRALAEDARRMRVWYAGWTAFYTVATGFSMKVALDGGDRDRRVGAAVDAVRSGLGLVTTVLFVPPSLSPPRLADGDVAAREKWLEEAADAERLGRSWLSHLGNAAVNAAGGGYLWLHEHRFVAGLVAFVSGTLIGEVKIWTQPTTAEDARTSLRAARSRVQIAVAPTLSTTSLAVTIQARF